VTIGQKKIGLVLGGGGAKGGAHIAVIKGLEELGIRPSFVTGCSVGALIGGLYSAGFFNDFCKLIEDVGISDIPSLVDVKIASAGFIKGEKLINFLKTKFGDLNIEDLKTKFSCVATDIVKGEEKVFNEGSLFDAIRASISLPLVFTPFRLGKNVYLDGGLVNPLPIELCRKMGAEFIIAVNLFDSPIQNTEKNKKSIYEPEVTDSLIARNLKIIKNYINKKVRLKPSLYDVSNRSIDIMQFHISKSIIASHPPELLISPKLSDIGILEFYKLEEAIEQGKKAYKKIKKNLK
jgi:NTE family protein